MHKYPYFPELLQINGCFTSSRYGQCWVWNEDLIKSTPSINYINTSVRVNRSESGWASRACRPACNNVLVKGETEIGCTPSGRSLKINIFSSRLPKGLTSLCTFLTRQWITFDYGASLKSFLPMSQAYGKTETFFCTCNSYWMDGIVRITRLPGAKSKESNTHGLPFMFCPDKVTLGMGLFSSSHVFP